MSSGISLPEEDLSCPVCCDIFMDPVLLPCSHSFCKGCLQRCWDTSAKRECPICRRKVSKRSPTPSNLALKNLCEALQSSTAGNKVLCTRHGERLKLFCLVDKQPVCVVCQASKIHKNHDCSPIEEASLDCKNELSRSLKTLQDTLDILSRFKAPEAMLEHIKSQAQRTERQIKDQFEQLHQLLYDEEAARLAALKEEEEEKLCVMEVMMTEITARMLSLTETIRILEQEMNAEDMTLLQNFKVIIERANCVRQGPERVSGKLIDVAKHLCNLKYRVSEKILQHSKYTPVTLDSNTAHPCLILSDDLTSLHYTSQPLCLPDNPERFHISAEVLGMTGFCSGSHCWHVETGSNEDWLLGVVCMSVPRNVEITARPENGFWTLCLRDGEYRAMTSLPTPLTVARKPQSVRVQLDWDKGEVSFFDPADDTSLYSFSHKFTEKVFPYFYTQSKNPLRILPECVCVAVGH